jgi:hypothetical protein
MKGMMKVGTYTGTGAVVTVQLGFVPTYVRTINITDGDAGATYLAPAGETAKNITEGAALATLASNGITAYAGTVGGNNAGFTAGTSVSASAKVYYYIAMREDG